MASAEKRLTYEEERQHIIEENKRRMKELGLMETVESIQKLPMSRKPPIRRVSTNIEFAMETRRSSRAASRPKVDYKEVRRSKVFNNEASIDIGLRRTRGLGRPLLRRGYVSPAAKNEAAVRAGDIKTSRPSFVKAMLKSHTSGGFWLGLPSDFCNMNFTKDDIIVLEDEEGLEWECVYLHNKHGLSGGWRGFSLDHVLQDGDATVFELVTSSRFKVYITRAAGSGEPLAQKVAAMPKKRDYQYVVKDSKIVHARSALQESLKREKGDQFYGKKRVVCKHYKSGERVKRNSRSGPDWSPVESQKTDNVLEDTSEDDSKAEDSNKDEPVQSSDDDIQPARKLKEEISRPAKRPMKSKQQSLVVNFENSNEEQSDDIQQVNNLKEKILQVSKRTGKAKQQLNAKSELKSLQIIPGRRERAKVSMKVLKKDTFVRRADRKTDMQDVRKESAARQIEQKCNLPPGTRLKPVGVCSIARGSMKRKLPAIFPSRKYSFFNGPKSVKVH